MIGLGHVAAEEFQPHVLSREKVSAQAAFGLNDIKIDLLGREQHLVRVNDEVDGFGNGNARLRQQKQANRQ